MVHRVVTRIYSWWFDIPLASMIPFVNERLLLETNFVNEADNAERMAKLIAGESRLRGRAYIPRVYRELSSERVMTAEWIEGVSLWNKEGLTKPWRGGRGVGSPGCQGTPLDQSNPKQLSETSVATPAGSPSKPNRDWWKGPDGLGGLGLSLKEVMTIMVDIFSAQMFLWGWVHCDPHPGNIFIRRLPSGKPELVLIDHGLYVHLEPTFRHEYSLFWKSLMTFDNTAVGEIAQKWGAQNADIFASATLMRPYTGGDHSTSTSLTSPLSGTEASERAYEMQQKMRKAMRQILADESKFPKPLLFLGRNLRIVQGNNQFLGSPVNRIKITGWWASRSLAESSDLPWRTKLRNLGRHVLFTLVMWSSDLVFWGSRLRQVLGWGRRGGMEEEIEERMKVMMKDFGVELNHAVFEG